MTTIRRRLDLSSLVVLIIAIFIWLSLVAAGRAALIVFNLDGQVDYGFIRGKVADVVKLADQLAADGSRSKLLNRVADFNARYGAYGFNLLVYHQGRQIAGQETGFNDDIADLMSHGGRSDNRLIIVDSNVFFARTVADYRLVLINDKFSIHVSNEILDHISITLIIALLVLTIAITLSGVFLRYFVFRRVTAGIDVLTSGVDQISRGNLGYRLIYSTRDEFFEICRVFNHMSARLAELDEQNKRADADQRFFVAGISHDLRGPLAAIKAHGEGLADGLIRTGEARAESFGIIKSKAEQLEGIIQKLSAFAQMDLDGYPLNLEYLDLNGELQRFVESVKNEYGDRGLDLRFEALGRPVTIHSDLSLLRTVLINICDNSLKYRQRDRGRLKISGRVIEGQVRLSLTDDGPGVPDKSLALLFKVFYRTDSAREGGGEGHGLGLAICAAIMKRLGGKIEAANAAAGGLETTISLPVENEREDDET